MRPDVIKLDRALVENLHTDAAKLALLESFINFARRTDAQLCAEGIESDAELDTLAAARSRPWPGLLPRAARTAVGLGGARGG